MKYGDTSDTIVALSSPAGVSVRSIVRLSGPRSYDICREVLGIETVVRPTGPSFFQGYWCLDAGLSRNWCRIQYWPDGGSYTGQELVECHLDVPNVLAERLMIQFVHAGARPAIAGEFSMRAFLSGRMDLTQAEAVAGIFHALTPKQVEVALEQMAGGLSRRLDRLRGRLLDLLAWMEATMDFVEEDDVNPVTRNFVGEELKGASWELSQLMEQWVDRDKHAGAWRVLLVGRPNAGKSSLFNAIIGQGRALVSAKAGTTRDYLEAVISIGEGIELNLVDTAGLAERSIDAFDSEAQLLARRELSIADLVLFCISFDEPIENGLAMIGGLPEGVPVIVVRTKEDLRANDDHEEQAAESGWVGVSAEVGTGLTRLKEEIVKKLSCDEAIGQGVLSSTRARAMEALRSGVESLRQAGETYMRGGGEELVALDLRSAVESLDVITGRDVTEEVLDRVFSRFCIGK